MSRKAELLEERKKKWSASRAVSDLTAQVTKEACAEQPSSPSGKRGGTDAILHRLTDKLTEHIRHELQREMQSMKSVDVRETVAEKMDSYLEAELSTHTCKICFELMTSPVHTPILLFPCGHTFCQQCMDSHFGKKGQLSASGKTCPYCRTKIETRAVNQSLKDLIDQFSKQKLMVSNRSVQHLDDVFPSRNSPSRGGAGTPSSSSGCSSSKGSSRRYEDPHSVGPGSTASASASGRGGEGSSAVSHYAAQLRSCEMRYTILRNEMDEVSAEENQLATRKTKISKASEHLLAERDKLDAKLQLLQEERALIDQHLAEQRNKQGDLARTEGALRERAALVRGTLGNLQAEMDKLRLLVQGVRSV